jgi:hypothetical protein
MQPIIVTVDFSTEALKERGAWSNIFQALKEKNCNLDISVLINDILHN